MSSASKSQLSMATDLNEADLNQKKAHPSMKISIFNTDENKHLLSQSINSLSTKIQKDNASFESGKGNFVILKLENDAIDYIEKVNFDVLHSLLVESSKSSPENECARVMINLNRADSTDNLFLFQITDLESTVARIKNVLPRTYAEEACVKAESIIAKCQRVFAQSKKAKLLKAFMDLPIATTFSSLSSNSIKLNEKFNTELMQFFTFPLDRFHNILCSLYQMKVDIYVTLYLISVLEHITRDILYLSTSLVRLIFIYLFIFLIFFYF